MNRYFKEKCFITGIVIGSIGTILSNKVYRCMKNKNKGESNAEKKDETKMKMINLAIENMMKLFDIDNSEESDIDFNNDIDQ